MKTFLSLGFCFISLLLAAQQQCNIEELVYPEFEQNAISIWQNEAPNLEDLNRLKTIWEGLKADKPFLNTDNAELLSFETSIDQIFYLMNKSLQVKKYSRVKDFAFQIILECRDLRNCLSKDVLALDLIWNMQDIFNEVNVTVNDPLFGLLEWEEFEDMVNQLEFYWTDYVNVKNEDIASFYPAIDFKLHDQQKDKVTKCLEDFMASLESGYQKDFQIPCNELAAALSDLIRLYALG